MTLTCELCQSKVSFQSYLAGLYHRIVNYTVDIFIDILKIYELPKIRSKKPKYCQTLVLTIIIKEAISMSQLHLPFELYPY